MLSTLSCLAVLPVTENQIHWCGFYKSKNLMIHLQIKQETLCGKGRYQIISLTKTEVKRIILTFKQ